MLAASVAVFRDGKVLLATRTKPPADQLWSLPGGKVEAGETLEEAALRELDEEVGVTARILGFNRHVEIFGRDAAGRGDASFRRRLLRRGMALGRADDRAGGRRGDVGRSAAASAASPRRASSAMCCAARSAIFDDAGAVAVKRGCARFSPRWPRWRYRAAPVAAQQRTGPAPAGTGRSPPPALNPSRRPRPTSRNCCKLAEIMGSLAYLRTLCAGKEAQDWRERMTALVEAEGRTPHAARAADQRL